MSAKNSYSVAVSLQNVSLYFGDIVAVDNLSVDIYQGEFFSMLGSSGSGKTSCLRLIAGFERPSIGEIFLLGRPTNDLPPFQRNVNTVFQDYALFPHMSVAQNVGYSLMIQGMDKKAISDRVSEMLDLVQLPGLANRKSLELSGGQRQRVSLARALINHPAVLLLDEPLGALDLKLREQMQEELKALQRKLGITFIYVTHDQHEALSMSDRVAIFNKGKIQQVGSPKQIYEHPETQFVAGFVGHTNLLNVKQAKMLFNLSQSVSIRPERIRLATQTNLHPDAHQLDALVKDIVYQGSTSKIYLDVSGISIFAIVESRLSENSDQIDPGKNITLTIARSDIRDLRD